jgi:hypothetical protein
LRAAAFFNQRLNPKTEPKAAAAATASSAGAAAYLQHGQVLQGAVPEACDVEKSHLISTLSEVPGNQQHSSKQSSMHAGFVTSAQVDLVDQARPQIKGRLTPA